MRTVLCVKAGAADATATVRGGTIQQFVKQSLARLGSFQGEATEPSQQPRGDADEDALLGLAGLGVPEAAGERANGDPAPASAGPG
jgi:hypothetical protein